MESILLKDGTQHFVGSMDDFRELIEDKLGFDAARYFENFQRDYDDIESNFEYDMNELKDEMKEMKEDYEYKISVLKSQLEDKKKAS